MAWPVKYPLPTREQFADLLDRFNGDGQAVADERGVPLYVVAYWFKKWPDLRVKSPDARKRPGRVWPSDTLREVSSTHEPTVPPGGPGLFGMKGAQLPGVMQHVFNDLVEKGHPHDGRTYALAIGIVKNWAHHKGAKDPAVIAKAIAAVAEWEKLKAEAHAKSAVKKTGDAVKENLFLSEAKTEELSELWSPAARAAAALARKSHGTSLVERPGGGIHDVMMGQSSLGAISPEPTGGFKANAFVFKRSGKGHGNTFTHFVGVHPSLEAAHQAILGHHLGLKEAAVGQPRKGKSQTYTNKFRGINKKTRTKADLMGELAAKGHLGSGASACPKP